MLVSALIAEISYALRGLDDIAPSENSDEAIYWLSVANYKKDDWAGDPRTNWKSLWQERTLATAIANGTNTYDLPVDYIRASDQIYVVNGTKRADFSTTSPENRSSNSTSVYISGRNPQVLNFNNQITAASKYNGWNIVVPGWYTPADMTTFAGTVPVDDPHWLSLATAAEIAFNDTSYEDKAPDILAKANELYISMQQNNNKGTATTPTTVGWQVKKIRGATC